MLSQSNSWQSATSKNLVTTSEGDVLKHWEGYLC